MMSEEARLKLSISRRGAGNPHWGKHLSEEHKRAISVSHSGELNGNWAGDKVGLCGLHDWVRLRLVKPEFCTVCGIKKTDDLCNKSGEYKRDLDDWVWMCRSCHMKSDGRMERLLELSKARKKPAVFTTCPQCGKVTESSPGSTNKYCSKRCSNIGRAAIKRRRNGNLHLV